MACYNWSPAIRPPIRVRGLHPNERFGDTKFRGIGRHGHQKIGSHQADLSGFKEIEGRFFDKKGIKN